MKKYKKIPLFPDKITIDYESRGEKIFSFSQIRCAALLKNSLTGNHGIFHSVKNHRLPAAWVLNMSASVVDRMIAYGLFVYIPLWLRNEQ